MLTGCSAGRSADDPGGLLHADTVWAVYAVMLVSGIARSFLQPTRTALSADLVPRELYLNAVTWRSSTWQFAAVAGPAAGGLLLGFAGAASPTPWPRVLLLVAWLALIRVAARLQPAASEGVAGMAGLLEGVHFLRSQPVLLGALTLDLFSVLFAGAEALLPVFATEILHVGAEGLGMLRAAPAAGSVLMSVYLSHRPLKRARRGIVLVSVALYGLCISGFGLSSSFPLSVLLLAFSGMFDNVSVVMRATLLQTLTPRHLLGRVAAVNAIFIGSSNEIGAFESGVAARLLGPVPAWSLGGMVPILVVGTDRVAGAGPQTAGEDRHEQRWHFSAWARWAFPWRQTWWRPGSGPGLEPLARQGRRPRRRYRLPHSARGGDRSAIRRHHAGG